jgi:UDP-N-acetyl-alpha-D-quinovosamine dehydrogenase
VNGSGSGRGDWLVVVTGADGFVGHALCAHLGASSIPWRGLVRALPSGAEAHRHGEHVEIGDLATVPDDRIDAALSGATAVVHLAGRAHVLDDEASDPQAAFHDANVVATVRLAHAAVRVGAKRFVFASTVKVNGEVTRSGAAFRPDDPPAPHDAYARTKLEAERALAGICASTPLVPLVLRLPLVYGPGVKGNFLALLDEIARGRPLPLGLVRNRRSLLYLGNLVEAIEAALAVEPAPHGVHFVADGASVSVPELLTATAEALRTRARLWPIPVSMLRLAGVLLGRQAAVQRLTGSLEVDASSFTAATGWRPRHTLQEGLAKTAAWWMVRHAI